MEERRGDGAKSVAYSQEASRGAGQRPDPLPCPAESARLSSTPNIGGAQKPACFPYPPQPPEVVLCERLS